MIKRALVYLATLTMATTTALLAWAAPAHAAWSDCAAPHVCLFDNYNGGTLIVNVSGSSGQCVPLTTAVDNRAASFYNRRTDGHHVQFYSNTNCTGHLLHYYANGTTGSWTNNPAAVGAAKNFIYEPTIPHVDTTILSAVFINTG